jgi:plastocyanin
LNVAQRRLRARFAAGLVGASLALVAVGGGVAVAADNPVAIANFSFSPKDVTVSVGDSVTWTNSDSTAHTATADDPSFDTGTIGNNTSKTVTFATAGVFAYHCSIHAAMIGTVTVQAAAAATTAPTNPPTDTEAVGAPGSSGGFTGAIFVITAAGLLGLLVARRRFPRG